MKKLMARVHAGNKGFTLVELIIVIAIIAVLAAVIAPQYIRYVESSREATDKNAVDEIAHAAATASVGDGDTTPTSTDFDITITSAGVASYEDNDLSDAVTEIIPATSYTFKSDEYQGSTVVITVTNGVGSASEPT